MPTRIYLLNVPLDIENEHTIYFPDSATQLKYFEGKIVKSYNDYNYQRQDEPILIEDHFDTIKQCNYAMYKNPTNNKWIFVFIKEMKFISDGLTEIHVETDVIQTYLFDYQVGSSFVEREHVDDDTVGLHTIPESLEKGEYVCTQQIKDLNLIDYCYVLQVTEWKSSTGDSPENLVIPATNFGGVPVAGGAYVFDSYSELAALVQAYQTGQSEAVIGAYMIPKKLIINSSGTAQYSGQSTPTIYEIAIDKPTKCDATYKPSNNKLLCYPYSCLVLSNNNGTSNVYQFEHFNGENPEKCKFKVLGVPVIGGSVKCLPLDYKGIAENEDEGIIGGKYPILSWSSDVYLNWLTQNSLNLTIGLASGVVGIAGGLGLMMTGAGAMAGVGAMAGGLMGITNVMKELNQASFMPDSAKGNVNGGDIITCNKTNTFYLKAMSIKREYAEMIDKYFDMYGYKVSTVKVPNKNHRAVYWYTKTIDANITGAISQNELQKIMNRYNKGITFWRHTASFRVYNVDNNII